MRVLNILLIICACLLLFIGLQTPETSESTHQEINHTLDLKTFDPRPNIEKVMKQLYPM